ncbi:MAG TPA: RluA family pseudouridine synthase [Kiritimatiellia bacterium]|nr:RluA family pseudouridine synthase [Kiritimatiellia bacterium]
MSTEGVRYDWVVAEGEGGLRLDVWLAGREGGLSRARWQELIKQGRVLVEGVVRKANHGVRAGERVVAEIPPPEPVELIPEAIPLPVVFEDKALVVVNKPAGMVVHPAPGHSRGTMVHALLHHVEDLEGVGGELRPGIVHRLDRDTSGLLVVAKSEEALTKLAGQFKSREVAKEYRALVWGCPRLVKGTVDVPIGRDPVHRQKMSVRAPNGRSAITHYEVLERFAEASLLGVKIETGRTHQIRVHLAHLGHPIVGDATYGRGGKRSLRVMAERQMLHAAKLAFRHPLSGKDLAFEAELPEDFLAVLEGLREGGKEG